jgi:hypothetical protein
MSSKLLNDLASGYKSTLDVMWTYYVLELP